MKIFHLEVSVQRFLDECSREEMVELEMLLGSPRYQELIREYMADKEDDKVLKKIQESYAGGQL